MKTRNMILAALFAALTAAGSFIRIPIGPVPITLQNLFTLLSGILLGPGLGALSQALYVLTGLFGLPVFASGAAGFTALVSPSFGYLLGFIAASALTGAICRRGKNSFIRIIAASCAGILAVYALGIPYLYLIFNYVMHAHVTFGTALKTGFLVFLPGDALKCIAAAVIGSKIGPALRHYRKD